MTEDQVASAVATLNLPMARDGAAPIDFAIATVDRIIEAVPASARVRRLMIGAMVPALQQLTRCEVGLDTTAIADGMVDQLGQFMRDLAQPDIAAALSSLMVSNMDAMVPVA